MRRKLSTFYRSGEWEWGTTILVFLYPDTLRDPTLPRRSSTPPRSKSDAQIIQISRDAGHFIAVNLVWFCIKFPMALTCQPLEMANVRLIVNMFLLPFLSFGPGAASVQPACSFNLTCPTYDDSCSNPFWSSITPLASLRRPFRNTYIHFTFVGIVDLYNN